MGSGSDGGCVVQTATSAEGRRPGRVELHVSGKAGTSAGGRALREAWGVCGKPAWSPEFATAPSALCGWGERSAASPKPLGADQTPSTLCGLVNQILALSGTQGVGCQGHPRHGEMTDDVVGFSRNECVSRPVLRFATGRCAIAIGFMPSRIWLTERGSYSPSTRGGWGLCREWAALSSRRSDSPFGRAGWGLRPGTGPTNVLQRSNRNRTNVLPYRHSESSDFRKALPDNGLYRAPTTV